ncbi:MAG: hypothetical protein JNM67_08050 [Bacteroidetes bacterium]|jgi:hypothetical protein|nr:hypothetical protein [Bacteroidota bacterium]
MRHLSLIFICFCSLNLVAQEEITMLNFFQAGAIPATIDQKGKNISTSGLSFNYIRFKEPSFFRMDATWLFRYLLNGEKDSANFSDTNKVMGLDLPVFTATYGKNIIQGDDFSLGLGINLDSRTFYSSPQQKAESIIDAMNVGLVLGIKIKLKDWLTYTTLGGYDHMFVDKNFSNTNGSGTQIYLQNNFSFLLKGKFGINAQLDMSFKSFDNKGIHGGQIFNKNMKIGLVYALQ